MQGMGRFIDDDFTDEDAVMIDRPKAMNSVAGVAGLRLQLVLEYEVFEVFTFVSVDC